MCDAHWEQIDGFVFGNLCRVMLAGVIVEDLVTHAGDPRGWRDCPDVALLRDLVREAYGEREGLSVAEIADYIWLVFIAPLRDHLAAEWERLAMVCPRCGAPTEIRLSFLEGGDTGYRETCPRCHGPARETCP